MRLNIFFSLIVLSLFLATCTSSTDPGEPLNLEGRFSTQPVTTNQVFNLQQHTNDIFAATDGGLLQIDLSGQAQWETVFFDTASVKTMLILEDDFWLASVFFAGGDNLFKSMDQGGTWSPFRNGFGGERPLTPTIMDGYIVDGDTVVFARSSGLGTIARSTDGGRSWEPVVQTWENPTLTTNTFVTVNPNRRSEVWAGGSSAIFQPQLFRSENGGTDWIGFTVIDNVETTVFDVAISPSDANTLLAGLGIGIRKSTNGGQTFGTVFEGSSTYTLAQSPGDGRVVYASGQNARGTLFFAASGDFGDTWETVEMENSPTGLRVNDMISIMQGGTEVLYLGTNKGVYSYRFEK